MCVRARARALAPEGVGGVVLFSDPLLVRDLNLVEHVLFSPSVTGWTVTPVFATVYQLGGSSAARTTLL